MRFVLPLLDLAAALVPDFLALGLVGPAFFSLYCVLNTLDLARTVDTDLALGISLGLAYMVTIVLNLWTPLLIPPRSRIPALAPSRPRTKPPRYESSQETREAKPVEHGGALTES